MVIACMQPAEAQIRNPTLLPSHKSPGHLNGAAYQMAQIAVDSRPVFLPQGLTVSFREGPRCALAVIFYFGLLTLPANSVLMHFILLACGGGND